MKTIRHTVSLPCSYPFERLLASLPPGPPSTSLPSDPPGTSLPSDPPGTSLPPDLPGTPLPPDLPGTSLPSGLPGTSGLLESLLFFDIETTGFSGDRSMLYLIGCIAPGPKTGQWDLVQWFADTPGSEPELLTAFFTYLKERRCQEGGPILLHFNGDTFDIPFLLKRCRHHGLPYDFSGIRSVDIYQKIRPYKTLLGLESLKQKAVERFLKLDRTDQYSGGQLVEVYHRYLQTGDPKLYDLLLLHNEEDLKGMPLICPVLSYPDMLTGDLSLQSQQVIRQDAAHMPPAPVTGSAPVSGDGGGPAPDDDSVPAPDGSSPAPGNGKDASSRSPAVPVLELVFKSPCTVPIPFRSPGRLPGSRIRGEGDRLLCLIPLYEGELRYFYPDYKDYYYLPVEDMAVHKSVGAYVTKEARVKATAKTCYTRTSGLFLPQPSPIWQPVFQKAYKDAVGYVLYTRSLFQDPEAARRYLLQLLPC